MRDDYAMDFYGIVFFPTGYYETFVDIIIMSYIICKKG